MEMLSDASSTLAISTMSQQTALPSKTDLRAGFFMRNLAAPFPQKANAFRGPHYKTFRMPTAIFEAIEDMERK